MVTAVVRRWTEITMVLAGSSHGLCSIQAWLFYEELAVDMIRLNSFYTLTIFDYLPIDPFRCYRKKHEIQPIFRQLHWRTRWQPHPQLKYNRQWRVMRYYFLILVLEHTPTIQTLFAKAVTVAVCAPYITGYWCMECYNRQHQQHRYFLRLMSQSFEKNRSGPFFQNYVRSKQRLEIMVFALPNAPFFPIPWYCRKRVFSPPPWFLRRLNAPWWR